MEGAGVQPRLAAAPAHMILLATRPNRKLAPR